LIKKNTSRQAGWRLEEGVRKIVAPANELPAYYFNIPQSIGSP